MLELVVAALALLLLVRVSALARAVADMRTRLDRTEARLGELIESPATSAPSAPLTVEPAVQARSTADLRSPAAPHARGAPAAELRRDLEQQIGSRWMLIVGTLVLVLGIAFFIKYAFENRWIDERARVAIGTAAGVAAWVAGLRFASAGYVLYGRIVSGAGLAIVYLAAFAASALYGIVAPPIAFGWMVLASAGTVLTADRQKSVGLALTAIALAFASPFLVGSNAGQHVMLFAFDLALAVATHALVRRHRWPALGPTAFCLAWATFGVWAATSYRPAWFASTELYLTALTATFLVTRREYARDRGAAADAAALTMSTGPALYYLASVAVLFDHSVWLLVFFIAFTAAAIAVARDSAEARLAVWAAVAVPFFAWASNHVASAWYIATIATACGMYALHLFVQLEATRPAEVSRSGGTLRDAEVVLFHANGLGLFGFTYIAVTSHSGSTAALAAMLAVWHAAIAYALRERIPTLVPHALALAFAFTAVAIAVQLTGPWIAVAWAAEAFAITWIGLRLHQPRLRAGGVVLMALAVGRLVITEFGTTLVTFTPVLNARSATGAFIVALMYGVVQLYSRATEAGDARRATTAWIAAANILTVGLVTADIDSYWRVRDVDVTASLARELSVSLAWAAYAMGAMAIGFRRRSTRVRYFALVLFGVTIVKMFAVDLLELGGIYRITAFVALGVVLLIASFLYQRQRSRTGNDTGDLRYTPASD